jgi:hypothetical protein
MRTSDGIIVEIFEWVSKDAIAGAHKHPAGRLAAPCLIASYQVEALHSRGTNSGQSE